MSTQAPTQTRPADAELRLSPSVKSATARIDAADPVSAATIVNNLLELHSEYAGGRAHGFRARPGPNGDRKTAAGWLGEVRALFDPIRVPQLHGRQVILGLSLLDRDLSKQLSEHGLLDALKQELREPFDSLLVGKHKQDAARARENVPFYTDSPATEDALGRQVLARVLAARIRAMRKQQDNEAFLLHIHGRWGAGKTSLLNFLSKEFKAGAPAEQAVVVHFNAWQHQRLGTPWWSLMDAVYRCALRHTPGGTLQLRIGEFWWRHIAGKPHYLGVLTLLALIVFLALSPSLFGVAQGDAAQEPFTTVSAAMESLNVFLTALIGVWGFFLTIGRSLLPGRERAAQQFIETTRDPMERLTRHFHGLIAGIGKPVCIFIDDLDRCRESYVVELLEGIQTLFREPPPRQGGRRVPVTYVIAADRNWLYASFNKTYETFTSSFAEPGRPLGFLFLEKIFQLSVGLPRISPTFQKAYWQRLIEGESGHAIDADIQQARGEAARAMQQARTLDDIDRLIREQDDNPIRAQAYREEAIIRYNTHDMEMHTEHALLPFAPLLEPNPRAMIRLVNAYGIERDIALLAGNDIPIAPLALWTIITLRWPRLAAYLEDQPDMVRFIGQKQVALPEEVPTDLRALFRDPDVRDVVDGNAEHVDARLDEQTIGLCAGLRRTASGDRIVA
jgi:hypothetical protein